MEDATMQMFKELTEAPGAPGQESAVREVMKKYIAPYADEITYDGLGSLIAKKQGASGGPKIAIAGHLDEVAFMVTQITDGGFLRFQPLGGWWAQVMLAQRVHVHTRNGAVEGIIGSVPPHILSAEARRKVVDMRDMFIDVGAVDKKEVEEFGIRIGDAITPICPFTVLKNPKMLMAKAWDNRVGCAATIDVLKRLQGTEHPNTVFGVGTVMEEVGMRGGQTSSNLIQPDIAIAVDVGIAGDTPGINKKDADSRLGKGPEICLYDARLIAQPKLREFIISVAKENEIPYQLVTVPGGATDAAPMHLTSTGVPAVAISIPARYIHSHASIIHYDDYENLVKLLVALIHRLDDKQVKAFTSF